MLSLVADERSEAILSQEHNCEDLPVPMEIGKAILIAIQKSTRGANYL